MIEGAHLHLLVNHAPIFASIFALCLLIASYFTSANVLRKAALVVLVLTALAGVAANLSGEEAEDAIRGFPGVKREVIEEHEAMGDKAYLLAGALGLLSLGALARWRREPIPRGVATGALVATAFVAGAMAYTGLLGGQVRHTEVRPGATPADALVIEPRRERAESSTEP